MPIFQTNPFGGSANLHFGRPEVPNSPIWRHPNIVQPSERLPNGSQGFNPVVHGELLSEFETSYGVWICWPGNNYTTSWRHTKKHWV